MVRLFGKKGGTLGRDQDDTPMTHDVDHSIIPAMSQFVVERTRNSPVRGQPLLGRLRNFRGFMTKRLTPTPNREN
ncbi:hypothetical protein TcasGA2_TC009921 [Tribolium castaneum]|uniref:Uncharacterized protein n=1 Tax=Tribolium castaneum TaxID=7070 RepID=D6WQF5_TRICA|nr:hypothetical protein TcasGA2_TC009921 [Tribolium castaneum]